MTETLLKEKDWKEGMLNNLAEVIGGYAFRGEDFGDTGFPVVKIKDITPPYVDIENTERIDSNSYDFEKLEKFKLTKGDYLVAMTGATIGKVGRIISGEMSYLNQRVAKIKARQNLADNNFVYYLIRSKSFERYINAISSGSSVQQNISAGDIGGFPIFYPVNKKEQEEIATVLLSLDNKIELLQKQNEILEEIAKAIFHEWFVEFNFPDEQGNPYKSSGGKMVESELGGIPENWFVRDLGDIADVIDCLHSKKPNQVLENTGNILLQLENIKDNGLLDISEKYFITDEDYSKWISRIEASEDDCVITNVGRVGAVSRIPKEVRAALGRNMTAVRVKSSYNYPYFLIGYLTSQIYKEEMNRKTDAGTILNALNVRNISKLRVIIPEATYLINVCNQILATFWQKMEANISFINRLSVLRDTLLPKLLNGEIKVKA